MQKLHFRIFRAEENIASLLRTIYSWALTPILERKDFKSENLLALNERDENLQKRYDQITYAAKELNRVLDENYKLFFDLLPDSLYKKSEFELDESNSYYFSKDKQTHLIITYIQLQKLDWIQKSKM